MKSIKCGRSSFLESMLKTSKIAVLTACFFDSERYGLTA